MVSRTCCDAGRMYVQQRPSALYRHPVALATPPAALRVKEILAPASPIFSSSFAKPPAFAAHVRGAPALRLASGTCQPRPRPR